MKRPLTLVGFILTTITNTIFTIVTLISLVFLLSNLSFLGSNGATIILIVCSVFLVAIVGLLFNAFCIQVWNKDLENYKLLKNRILTSVIINSLPIFYLIFFYINKAEIAVIIGFLVLFILNSISNILILIDFFSKREKNKDKLNIPHENIGKEEKIEESISEQKIKTKQEKVEAVKEVKKETGPIKKKTEQKKSELEQKLEKLLLMKEAEMITEEEHKQIKKKYIMEELAKKL